MKDSVLSSVPPQRQRLVRLCQNLGFGRIETLSIKNGQPCFDPAPRVIRRRKAGALPSRQSTIAVDFALKREWVEFFNDLDSIGSGTILSIELAHGLPIIHEFEEPISN